MTELAYSPSYMECNSMQNYHALVVHALLIYLEVQ